MHAGGKIAQLAQRFFRKAGVFYNFHKLAFRVARFIVGSVVLHGHRVNEQRAVLYPGLIFLDDALCHGVV